MCKIKTVFYLLILTIVPGLLSAQGIQLVEAFPNIPNFTRPVVFTHAGDGTNRVFVVEQAGRIKVLANDSTTSSVTTFLDITAKVDDSSNEEGLLGLAFHPDYANNGYFYVNYIATPTGSYRRTRISRFQVSAGNPNAADTTEFIIKEIFQPFSNHNGGNLMFGLDGYLYIGMGDGGSSGDPNNRAQHLDSLLGKILRIDIDTMVAPNNYGIPPTNPYASGGGAPEIFTVGMRNPWRFSQDPVTGQIWCGDVGQNAYEEIDLLEIGNNYGWRCYEANHTYNTGGCGAMSNYTFPVKEYAQGSNGFSVTGGYIYRGSRRPELVGRYIYGDYVSKRVWKLKYDAGIVTEDELLLTAPGSGISSFGVDQDNELYICNFDGNIYKFNLSTTGVTGNGSETPSNYELKQNYPNPFNPSTSINYSIPKLSNVKLVIYNSLGKEVNTLVNTTQLAGNYNRIWDGKDNSGNVLPSGVYFYTITAGDFADSKKMLLLK